MLTAEWQGVSVEGSGTGMDLRELLSSPCMHGVTCRDLSPGWRRVAETLCEVQCGLQLSLLHIFYEDTEEKGWLYPIIAGCSEKMGFPS